MFELKPISHDGVAAALAKAERYRLLNEPGEAESICRDILEIEPANQQALISLILALTDQIPDDAQAFHNALSTVESLETRYDQAYYAGIAWERRAKARYQGSLQGAHRYVYEWIVKAMQLFEEAAPLRAAGNDDAALRWNACVRFLRRDTELGPTVDDLPEAVLLE